MLVGQPHGFFLNPLQSGAVHHSVQELTQTTQAVCDLRVLKQMFNPPGTSISKCEAESFIFWRGKGNGLSELIERRIHCITCVSVVGAAKSRSLLFLCANQQTARGVHD